MIQKKLIDKFNEIIDDWLKRVKTIIDNYKKKLELYYQINRTIFDIYEPKTNYYEEIKNVEYIRTDFEENFYNIINSENDFKRQNSIILKLLNDNIDSYLFNSKIDIEKKYKNSKLKDTKILNGYVKHIYEIKKEGILIVNINNNNNNKDELYLFKEIEDNNKSKKFIPQFSREEDFKILNLNLLKCGYLLIVYEKQFKIYEISSTANSLKTIQNIKIQDKNDKFKNIIELINGYLVSISYSTKDINQNNIIFWKKNIMVGHYEIYRKISKKERPIEILEINKEIFVVLFEKNILKCYNSINFEENKNNLLIIDSPFSFKKMIKIYENDVVFIYENNFILFSLSSLQVKTISIQFNITDIFYISNSNNYFLASFSEGNNHGFLLLKIDFLKYKIYTYRNSIYNKAHSLKINSIYQLSNGDIITGSDDKTIKFWETEASS